MLYRYTEQDEQKFEELKQQYRDRLINAIDREERARLQIEFNNQWELLREEIQKTYFDDTFKGDENLILQNVASTAKILLKNFYDDVTSIEILPEDVKTYEQTGVGTLKDGTFFLFADFAKDLLSNEFRLHIVALKTFDCRKQIDAYIAQAIKESDFILDKGGRKKPKKSNLAALATAKEQGAITSINNKLTVPSSKKYQHAFTSYINDYAYLVNGSEGLWDDIINDTASDDDEKRPLFVSDRNKERMRKAAKEKPVDQTLIAAFYSALIASKAKIVEEGYSTGSCIVEIYLPAFRRELGLRMNKEGTERNKNTVFDLRFREIQYYIGVLQQSTYYSFCSIIKYDLVNQFMTLLFPYFGALREAMRENGELYVKNKKGEVLSEKNNNLIDSKVTASGNQIAVDVAFYLTNGLKRRGIIRSDAKTEKKHKLVSKDEKKITFEVLTSTVVKEVPSFKQKLDNVSTNSKTRRGCEKSITTQKNRILKATFNKALEIIRESCQNVYKQFEIKVYEPGREDEGDYFPTMSRLDKTKIIMSYYGKKADEK